jgi:hypothetical protein
VLESIKSKSRDEPRAHQLNECPSYQNIQTRVRLTAVLGGLIISILFYVSGCFSCAYKFVMLFEICIFKDQQRQHNCTHVLIFYLLVAQTS